MAAVHSPKLAIGRERGFAGGLPSSSQQHAAMRASSIENLSSSPTSRVFEGMLRTTTETGDIGVFSIKPSKSAQQIGPPRKIYQPPQPIFRHAKIRDGRRNLPSNTPDASLEIVSMYDAASQKSTSQNSDLNYPHYRSYSATYSSSTLSNRRSYASLTRQMGEYGSLQRPRSPFTSPLGGVRRTPRPCYPALVDGDGSGPAPRSEVERPPYVSLSLF
jgi:hypothetical protein